MPWHARGSVRDPATSASAAPGARRGLVRALPLAAALLIVGATVAAVDWPVLRSQAIALDDDVFVTKNALVTHPGWASAARFFSEVLNPSTVSAYYLPLSMTSLMLDYAMGGRPSDQRVFHRTNLALHVLSTLLLLLILQRLFGALVPAAFVALLFGLHPLGIEPLASIGERKTLLAECFAFASVLAYVESIRRENRAWRVASVALFALALLSKPSVTPLPLLLLLLDCWPLRRLSWTSVVEKWPFALLSLASATITVLSVARTWELGVLPASSPLRTVLQVCYLIAFYLGKLVWPRDLSCVYAPPEPFALSNPTVGLSVAVVGLLTALAVLARRWPGLLVGWGFFLVALAPTFGILAWSSVIAYDRYVYFPALGIALPLAAGLTAAWQWPRMRGLVPRLLAAGLALVVLASEAGLARATLAPWRDSLTLWRHIVALAPGRAEAHNGLGCVLMSRSEDEQAVREFQRALEVGPNYADAHFNLGLVLSREGRLAEAIQHLRQAAQLQPGSPAVAYQLGLAAQRAGRLGEAAAYLQRALEIRPGDVDALDRLGFVRVLQGRTQEGLGLLRAALELAPADPRPHLSLAMASLHAKGLDAEVMDHLEQAARLRPDWPMPIQELAWIKATSPLPAFRDTGGALRLSARALELSGGREASALDTRAAAEASAGWFAQAVLTAQDALRLVTASRDDSLARRIQARLALYRRGAAYVDSTLVVRRDAR